MRKVFLGSDIKTQQFTGIIVNIKRMFPAVFQRDNLHNGRPGLNIRPPINSEAKRTQLNRWTEIRMKKKETGPRIKG